MQIRKAMTVFLAATMMFTALAGCNSGKEGSASLKVGAGSSEIIFPEEMFPMSEGFTTTHDNPHARVMLFENGEKIALVSMELVNCPTDCIDSIKTIVNEKTGTPKENVWVHSTHVFSTPHAPDDPDDKALFNEAVTAAATEAVEQAAKTLQAAKIGVATGESAVTANRNVKTADGYVHGLNGDGATDHTLTVLKAEAQDGKTIGLLFAYGTRSYCTDVSRGTSDREITSDFTGVAASMLEKEFGAPALYCMTAAGDQHPIMAALDVEVNADGSYTQIDLGVQEGLKIAQELGTTLGNDAIAVAKTITCDDSNAKIACTRGSYEWATVEGDGEMEIGVEAMCIGGTAFIGVKPEINCNTSLELKDASPFENTLLMSFVNGDQNYMPDAEAYEINTVESTKTNLAKGAAEQLVTTSVELLKGLK